MASMTFFRSFFWYFFNIVFDTLLDRFWCQLAPNLASKIDQKSIQEPSKIYPKFYLVSSTFLNRFLIDFGSNLGSSNPPFTYEKSWFLKIFMILLDCLLDGFWSQLGSILGWFWEPSWHQVGTKSLQKSIWKFIKKNQKLIFGGFWPPTPTSKGVQRNGFWSSWGDLGAKMAPRPLQEGLGTDFGRFLDWFCSILAANLEDLLTNLGPFSDQVWLICWAYSIDVSTNVVWCFSVFW